jgi:L-threonylcarbamoyladenylate synthase
VDLVLDDGAAALGIESAIVGFDEFGPQLLRPGALPREKIEALVGKLKAPTGETIVSPGQLTSHYAPRAELRLDARTVGCGEALLAFGSEVPMGVQLIRNLSPSGDVQEAAANLFAMLRELDASGCRCIAVMPIPEHDLGEAINDRLRRAAAGRTG